MLLWYSGIILLILNTAEFYITSGNFLNNFFGFFFKVILSCGLCSAGKMMYGVGW